MNRLNAFSIAVCLMLGAQFIPTEGRASAFTPIGSSPSAEQRNLGAPPHICDLVKLLARDHSGVSFDNIHPESRLVEDLGMDWLSVVEFIMDMEETFNFEISDDDAEKIVTVGDACDYASEHWGQ